jgi:hypothetical protein
MFLGFWNKAKMCDSISYFINPMQLFEVNFTVAAINKGMKKYRGRDTDKEEGKNKQNKLPDRR